MTFSPPRIRAGILDDYQGAVASLWPWERLAPAVETIGFREHFVDADDLASAVAGCQVLIAMRERTSFTREVFNRLPDLELIVTTGPGNAAIDLEAAERAGVVVSGTRYTVDSTVELTWGLILALARRIPGEDQSIRSGGWQTSIGPQLAGRTLGVIGLGRIGTRMAEIAQAFGMRVLVWSRSMTPERAAPLGVEAATKRQLFEESDYVSIHVPLTPESHGLVGSHELAWMKPSAFLINTSRGPVIDEIALVHAVRAGIIAGAGLDVYETEPLPSGHPLRALPGTVLTPHIGYVATDVYALWGEDAIEDIEAFMAGAPIRVLSPTRPALDLEATRVGVGTRERGRR